MVFTRQGIFCPMSNSLRLVLHFGEIIHKLCNIPLAATTARECARPSGNSIHVQTLLEQALNFAPGGAATRAHNFIRVGILHVHGEVLTSGFVGLIPNCPLGV